MKRILVILVLLLVGFSKASLAESIILDCKEIEGDKTYSYLIEDEYISFGLAKYKIEKRNDIRISAKKENLENEYGYIQVDLVKGTIEHTHGLGGKSEELFKLNVIFSLNLKCEQVKSKFNLQETNVKDQLDKFKWDFDSLTEEKKLTYCVPVFQMMKQRNVLDVYDVFYKSISEEEKDNLMKNLVSEFDNLYLMETVAYFNLVEDLDKQSIDGQFTDEMKVSYDKNDKLILKSGNYLNGLPYSEVLDSKIYSSCVHNYFVLTRENKNIQEIINKFNVPKMKKIIFEMSQKEWVSMLDKIIKEKKKE